MLAYGLLPSENRARGWLWLRTLWSRVAWYASSRQSRQVTARQMVALRTCLEAMALFGSTDCFPFHCHQTHGNAHRALQHDIGFEGKRHRLALNHVVPRFPLQIFQYGFGP